MSSRIRLICMSLLTLLLAATASLAQVAWVKNYGDGLKQTAADPKKFLVVDLSASWCGYCRRMEREVYTDPDFIEFSRSSVFLRLMTDTDAEGGELARKFRVRGFPTLVILNGKGEEVGRLEGARSSPVLIRHLKEIFEESRARTQ